MMSTLRDEDRLLFDWLRRDEYRRRYSVRRDECGMWRIRCRLGDIQPFGLNRTRSAVSKLCAFLTFRRPRDAARLRKRLPGYCRVTRRGKGDTELLIAFPENRLDEIADILGAYRSQHSRGCAPVAA